ncbi:uncharacterized protein LOC125210890 [Salvia hispanica]|uniref:uncharacterized protein LOC125210890 n=1 Tax=Salvia hispanica TaxID=49212 RepID=UPI002009D9EC|nr:uncharacterized protein LOC125210890 [Salvia hispanica]
MGSFSGLGIGLSFVFGCILMGLVAELYYLLWWKKKLSTTTTTAAATTKEMQEFSLLFCWRKPKSFSNSSSQELTNPANNHQEIQDLEIGGNKELALKCEEGIEAELMRVHNLCGPPRFLFTIKEESKEDLELSEDGRSRKGSRTRSLSDLFVDGGGIINPLFESLPEAELRRLRSSPPPKFKFLRDAEDKLLRRLAQEEAERRIIDQNLQQDSILEDGSFLKFLNVRDKIHNQVLPLPSSPTN